MGRYVDPDEAQVIQKDGYQIISPPKKLQKKANIRILGDKSLDLASVDRAEAGLSKLAGDFQMWMNEEVDRLQHCYLKYCRLPSLENRKLLLAASQDVRGHASTYGFPVAGRLAFSLCSALEESEALARHKDVLDRLLDAITAIVRQNARDEHPLAKELEKELLAFKRRKLSDASA